MRGLELSWIFWFAMRATTGISKRRTVHLTLQCQIIFVFFAGRRTMKQQGMGCFTHVMVLKLHTGLQFWAHLNLSEMFQGWRLGRLCQDGMFHFHSAWLSSRRGPGNHPRVRCKCIGRACGRRGIWSSKYSRLAATFGICCIQQGMQASQNQITWWGFFFEASWFPRPTRITHVRCVVCWCVYCVCFPFLIVCS